MNKLGLSQWEEKDVFVIDKTRKISRGEIIMDFEGELIGSAKIQYTFYYNHFESGQQHESDALYEGFVFFEGEYKNKKGSFVLQDQGTYKNGAAISKWNILPNSGAGELVNISGTGGYSASAQGSIYSSDFILG